MDKHTDDEAFHMIEGFDPPAGWPDPDSRNLLWTRAIIVFICCLLNLLFFIWVRRNYFVLFNTNDDYRMRLIISGRYTGTPSSQAVFLGAIVSQILAGLYRINPSVEWYGTFYHASIFLFACVCESLFLCQFRNIKDLIVRFLCVTLFSAVTVLNHLLMPQFTTIAAFWTGLSMVACLAFLDAQGCSRRCFWAALYVLSIFGAVQLRDSILELFLPMQVIFIVSDLLNRKFSYNHLRRRALFNFTVVCIAGIVIAVSLITNSAATRDPEYRSFREFVTARSHIYDYSGWADYEEHKPFYDSINFSKSAWDCMNARAFDVNPAVNAENFKLIREYTEKINRVPLAEKINDSLAGGLDSLFSVYAIHEIEALAVILLMFFLLIRRSPQSRLTHYFLWGSYLYAFACLIGLVFRGRMVARIVQSTGIVLAAVSMYIMGGMHLAPIEPTRRNICALLSTVMKWAILLLLSLSIAVSFSQWCCKDTNHRIKTLYKRTEMRLSMEKYMDLHPDDFLFYSSQDFRSGSDYVFRNPHEGPLNIDCLSNWNVFSPNYYTRNALFGFDSALDGFLNHGVLYAELGKKKRCPIESTLKEYGKTLEKVDEISVEDNVISIYRAVDME